MRTMTAVGLAALATAACVGDSDDDRPPTGFFITSAGPGQGANLGGLDGADRHCQSLAASAGAGQRTWRAYLSTSATGSAAAVNARDRIGNGPWYNVRGDLIARSVDELHSDANNLTKETALTELGAIVNGRGDTPNTHDILTGSTPEGRATSTTCGNWTSSGTGNAIVGHHDRTGTNADPVAAMSWNSSHQTSGCGQAALVSTGGAGLFYCFAAD